MQCKSQNTIIACLVVTAWLLGCSSTVQYQQVNSARSAYVTSLPPLPKSEAETAKPSNVHVWISGAWHWNFEKEIWAWQKGTWKKPPKEGYLWNKPTYEKRRDRVVVYTPGHWISKHKKKKIKSATGAGDKTHGKKPDEHPSHEQKTTEKSAKESSPEEEKKAEPATPAEPKEGEKAAESKKGTKAERAKPAEPTNPAESKKNKE